MQAKKILAAVASFCLIGAANAGDAFTWAGGTSADWDNAANWSPSNVGYPGEDPGDSVTIPDVGTDPVLNVSPANQLSGLTINASGKLTVGDGSTAYVLGVSGTTTLNGELVVRNLSQFDADGAVAINNGSTLDVKPGGTYDIGAGTTTYNGGTFKVGGEVLLSTSSSILDVQADLTFGSSMGTGSTSRKLVMQHNSAKVDILADKTFTNPSGFTIQGNGQITGAQVASTFPMFTNSGTVVANSSGVLLFGDKVEISGSSSVVFRVDHASATMRFERGTDSIIGDFEQLQGLLQIEASTVQADNFKMMSGTTIEAADGEFTYQSATGGDCDPGSPVTSDYSCT